MLGFWIALAAFVAGVLGAMAYYALKARAQTRPSRPVETTNPLPHQQDLPRPLAGRTQGGDGHPRPDTELRVRTERAGRQAR